MFFSTELLSRRDGGFGLLWLAATLGPKSSFSKLPKRSVLNADISQLCELIAQPQEPLSLRLSSNLMVGAARCLTHAFPVSIEVGSHTTPSSGLWANSTDAVKHDLFYADVNTCFTSLKRAVQDLRLAASAAALEMNNPVARPDALNMALDPGMGRAALDIDFLVPSWDEWIARAVEDLDLEDEDSEDYNPNSRKSKSKAAGKARAKPHSVPPTPGAHTLDEHHLHLLNTSLDGDSSSQNNGSFQLPGDSSHDDLLLDFGGAGQDFDLGLDLGEGWEFPTQATIAEQSLPVADHGAPMIEDDFPPIDFGGQGDVGFMMDVDIPGSRDQSYLSSDHLVPGMRGQGGGEGRGGRKRARAEGDEEDEEQGDNNAVDPDVIPQPPRSILVTPSRTGSPQPVKTKGKKVVRLLLDTRTELTEAEMKHAREKYVEEQNKLRLAELAKKREKEMMKRVDEFIWMPPPTFRAPELLEFWHNSFKVQIEARSGTIHLNHREDDHKQKQAKRRRVEEQEADYGHTAEADAPVFDGGDFMMMDEFGGIGFDARQSDRMRSSATPEMGRRGSKPPSVTGSGLGVDLQAELELMQDQPMKEPGRASESFFPWDNPAFPSSSSVAAGGLRTPSVTAGDAARLSRSRSIHSGSPAVHAGSLHGLSDVGGLAAPDEFQLDPEAGDDLGVSQNQTQSQSQSQSASQALAALEKNSFRFLEYAKAMAVSTASQGPRTGATPSVMFDDIVSQVTSNRNVAAAGFYHCLLLATKGHLRLDQPESFGPIEIAIL
ncbi:hypothetical protein AURDEDRAFT_120316 [Auricularia subglabra TFB-10046 SS5]|nr:hypothetical protein AURDEDRAFT_120316 [Auricularia subglabra TFB-10046 SS5]